MSILKNIRNWVEIDVDRIEKKLQIKLTLRNGPYRTMIWSPTSKGLKEFCSWITLPTWTGVIQIEKFKISDEEGNEVIVTVGIRITNKQKIILRFSPETDSPIEYEFTKIELSTLIEEICLD